MGKVFDDAIDACVRAACPAECPLLSEICDSGMAMSGADNEACADCLSNGNNDTLPGCCEQATACGTDHSAGGCMDLLVCYGRCSTQSCLEQCDTDNDAGKAIMDALDACQNNSWVPPCEPPG